MKKIFIILLCVTTMFACSDKEESLKIDKGTKFKVGFNLQKNGVSISEEKMGSGLKSSDAKDIYAIKIYEKDKPNAIIASGLFECDESGNLGEFKFEDLSLELQHGFDYTIEATMIRHCSEDLRNSIFGEKPICDSENKWIESPSDLATLIHVPETDNNDMAEYERWYFKGDYHADYNAAEADKIIDINLRRMSFATKFIADGLQDGYSVQIALIPQGLTAPATFNDYTFTEEEGKLVSQRIFCITNINTAYDQIAAGNDGISYQTYQFKYQILDGDLNIVKTSEDFYTIGKCKANSRYTITLDCATNAECSISINCENSDWIDETIDN